MGTGFPPRRDMAAMLFGYNGQDLEDWERQDAAGQAGADKARRGGLGSMVDAGSQMLMIGAQAKLIGTESGRSVGAHLQNNEGGPRPVITTEKTGATFDDEMEL